jgi:hypothetical protein
LPDTEVLKYRTEKENWRTEKPKWCNGTLKWWYRKPFYLIQKHILYDTERHFTRTERFFLCAPEAICLQNVRSKFSQEFSEQHLWRSLLRRSSFPFQLLARTSLWGFHYNP